MASPIAELLFSDYRRRVLGLLLMQPEQAYHVREIARLTQTQPGTLHKELSRLAEVGILEKMTQGNQVSYRANRQSLVFEELASIVRKTSGLADVLAQALLPLASQIELAWVFGSVASGKAGLHSDIDLLVVGSLGFSELVSSIYPCQSILGREINPKLYSPDEWSKALSENSVFIRELFEKPVIEIIGTRNLVRRHA
ncbi:nucleotidyltransferase domain-containing protein [Cellvibrio sp. UBA7661]|uniref:nucleotidyltransferase domain-containing protein n=1 Tax=Cellvibrio sp. UBA7661 TaxID=1946311 RepID=UPI002F35A323